MNEAVYEFLERRSLTREGFRELLSCAGDTEETALLKEEAAKVRRRYYGDKVYVRGLIEFTSCCKNNCYYCGIRAGNHKAGRYRLTKDEILDCCGRGYELGYRTFVFQGGEDSWYTDGRLTDIIRTVKETWPDCALTLSVGEKSRESYRRLREAGAERYLLRHETADEEHYRSLHPPEMSLKARKRCLYDLKELGYQTGAGFMVGSPGQTLDHLAQDLIFLKELKPQMVGIGPFIPHRDTDFAGEKAGSVELTLYLLSVIRLLLPAVLLPATTALGTLDPEGREKGILSGANVLMPNLTPLKYREQYSLYDNKISVGEEPAERLDSLARRMEKIGYRIVTERGDAAEEEEG